MAETFFILLAGGVMLAAAVSDPKEVTLQWLRLAGIIALTMCGLAGAFYAFDQRDTSNPWPLLHRVQVGLFVATALLVLAQLGFVQVARRRTQGVFAALAFVVAVLAGCNVLHEMMAGQGTAVRFPPKVLSMALQTFACAGVAAMTGLALMDMLLGHAYLTAAQMTMRPFARLNLTLAGVLVVRTIGAVGLVPALQRWRPMEMLWGVYGLLMITRWLVGLAVPAVFLYMAHDCIKRRSTQAATGILYVAGVLIFIGEIVALHLVRATGLPF
jgi:hypothetical protein